MEQLAHRLAGLCRGRLDQLGRSAQARIVRRQRAQAARHGAELRQRRALGLGQRLERRLRAGEKARAVLAGGHARQQRVPILPPPGKFFSIQ